MNAYRSVIAAVLVLMVLTVAAFWFLNDQGSTIFAAALLIGIVVADWISTGYVALLVNRDRRRPRSWLLLFLFTGSILITAGLSLTLFVLTRRLFGLPPLDAGLGLRLVSIGLILPAYVPVMKASLFWLVQRDPSVDDRRVEDVA